MRGGLGVAAGGGEDAGPEGDARKEGGEGEMESGCRRRWLR